MAFRATSRLLQTCKITLFTRESCSLCTDAREVLRHVWEKKPFHYEQIDVMKPEGAGWKNLYEFDVPVIHVKKFHPPRREDPSLSGQAKKLMHRFKAQEVLDLMNHVEKAD